MHIMKKAYIAPVSSTFELQCDGMLALSLQNNGGDDRLGNGDFNTETGDYEFCSSKKGIWEDTEW